MSSTTLPVILLSASDNATATKIISELIENEVEDNKYKEAGWRVWQFVNKYYTALVRVQPLIDGEELLDIQAEAHVIYLSENEDAEVAEARRVRAASAVRRGAVRLALVESAEITEGLASWGLRARYEAVALRGGGGGEEGGDGGGGVGEGGAGADEGAGRARGALHAHVWPSLRRRGAREPAALPAECSSSEGEGEGEGEEGSEGEGEEGQVERAEAFAEALGALAALRSRPPDAHEPRDLRLQRAEHLVAAFARALGHDLDAC